MVAEPRGIVPDIFVILGTSFICQGLCAVNEVVLIKSVGCFGKDCTGSYGYGIFIIYKIAV
jgi:hypothetical protein